MSKAFSIFFVLIFVVTLLVSCTNQKNNSFTNTNVPTEGYSPSPVSTYTKTPEGTLLPTDTPSHAPSVTSATTQEKTSTPAKTTGSTKTTPTRTSSAPSTTGPSPTTQPPEPKGLYLYPTSPNLPDHLYAVNFYSMSREETLLLYSMQGILAKEKPEIYIYYSHDQYDYKFLNILKNNYHVKVSMENNIWKILDEFKDRFKGYVVFDSAPIGKDPDGNIISNGSMNVAASLAGLKNAIIIDKKLINDARLKNTGLKQIMDVSDKDESWLVRQPEYWKLNKTLAFEFNKGYDPGQYWNFSLDYAIMTNSIVFFDYVVKSDMKDKIMADLSDHAGIVGWGYAGTGESDFVSQASGNSCYYLTLGSFNMTTISAYSNLVGSIKQPAKQNIKKLTAQNGKHYVSFLVTDGDHVSWALQGYNGANLYDSPQRGEVNMNWGMPGTGSRFGALMMKNTFDRASNGSVPGKPGIDEFITYSSLGYMYPSMYPQNKLEEHAKLLSGEMKRLDTNILGIIDFGQYKQSALPMWDKYTKQDNINAIIYVDYIGYATNTSTMLWSNNKPIIPSRGTLWKGLPGGSVQDITNYLNSRPTDPLNPNSYSVIMVHAWSMGFSDVLAVKDGLHDNIEIVNLSQLVDLVYKNVRR